MSKIETLLNQLNKVVATDNWTNDPRLVNEIINSYPFILKLAWCGLHYRTEAIENGRDIDHLLADIVKEFESSVDRSACHESQSN